MTGRRRLGADDRGVSVTVSYALNLVVAALLVAGVLTATGGMVEDRRESTVESELSVVGERAATDLSAADRLAAVRADDPTDDSYDDDPVSVSVSLPDRVGATRYEITVEESPTRLTLASRTPAVTVTVPFVTETPVEPTTVRGGDLRIVLTDDGALEVRAA